MMKKKGLKILRVLPHSIGATMGIREGDHLLSINGRTIHDPIDYRFYECEENITLEVAREHVNLLLSTTKEMDQDLGLELKEPRYKTCANNCIFCFVHQMPRGLRRTLYVKDDDYRLSFLHGNYITLTNLSDSDIERIIHQRLSPLYVSVHATNDQMRRNILGNPSAPPILPAMTRLTSEGITLHAQIVLCPGINDGAILEQSVKDLMSLWPGVQSVAVVPVGLTRHRDGLKPLERIEKAYARTLLDQVNAIQNQCGQRFGEPWIFPSDEFYLIAGRTFPPLKVYGDLPQLENGIGMAPLFMRGVESGLEKLSPGETETPIIIGTGVMAYPILGALVRKIQERIERPITLAPIRNRFFGDSVTVSGLITGSDLIRAFADFPLTGPVTLPSNMLRRGTNTFLDGMTIPAVGKKLGRTIQFVESSAEGLLSLFRTSQII
jgi:putative radical SAM enzyme (TIGR03279 family)